MLDAREPPIIKGFSAAYLALLGTLVLFVTLMGVAFIVLARQGQQGEQHFRYASEQRLLSRSVIAEAIEAARGKEAAFSRLKDSRDRFEQALQYEKVGNPSQGLPPVSGIAQTHVGTLETRWKPIRAEIDTILAAREPVVAVSNFQPLLEGSLNQMMVLSDEIAKSLANNRVDARQVYLATNQLQLLQRIDGDLRRMLTEGGISAAAAADRFNRNVGQFGRVLKGMREGDSRSGVERVTIPDGSSKLTDLLEIYKSLEAETGKIVERSPELVKVQNAAQNIIGKGDVLLEASNALIEEYTSGTQTAVLFGIPISHRIVYLLGLVVVVVLLVLFYVQHRESRARLLESERRKFETEEQNRRNQDAILRLLDELGNLADGDLTVQASVTEDITGAIADSVNFAIEALRELVSTINTTSAQVTRAVQETRAIADRMAKSSEVQARQIENVSSTVGQMARAMDEASAKTASSAEVAEKSVGIAHEGGDRVRMTINGMNAIREHIQDTSKRIKRLGETCQEIGDIVGLINGIADQTNFLALNAAIQATAAGDAGRGFAVVADEVQRLAERTSNATKRIETLVKTIQADTNEVVISMEKSTYEVVGGAGLAEKAGEALEEIEKVSAKLAERIDEISKITGRVSEMAARMSTAMSSINEITNQTADSSVMTAAAIGALQHMAQQLNQSVSGFRLPN